MRCCFPKFCRMVEFGSGEPGGEEAYMLYYPAAGGRLRVITSHAIFSSRVVGPAPLFENSARGVLRPSREAILDFESSQFFLVSLVERNEAKVVREGECSCPASW